MLLGPIVVAYAWDGDVGYFLYFFSARRGGVPGPRSATETLAGSIAWRPR